MKSRWEIFDSGTQTAEENMRLDGVVLENLDNHERPILRFYEWACPSLTYGHFIDPARYLNVKGLEQLGLSLAKRPTGGGIVFHLWDMAFSALVPAHCHEFSQNTLENYALINQVVLSAVQDFSSCALPFSLIAEDMTGKDRHCDHFCMAKPTKYDVMWQGKKIAGAAQRKTRKGFLHQGTILLAMPDTELLSQVLLPGTQVLHAMQMHSYPLLGSSPSLTDLKESKQYLRTLLVKHLNDIES